MKKIKWWRFRQTLKEGLSTSREIMKEGNSHQTRLFLYFDIILTYLKYYVRSAQYKDNKIWALSKDERKNKLKEIGKENLEKDKWVQAYYDNWNFLNKWSGFNWQRSPLMVAKRNAAYTKQYNLGEGVAIQYGVTFIREHQSNQKLHVGKKVLFARNVDIDYTGGLEIGNGVEFAEGVKVLTHNHDFFGMVDDQIITQKNVRAYPTPLVIEDNVFIGAHCLIMPGVSKIGKNSMIAPGSVVLEEIPANTIWSGNPAKKVGKLPRVYYRYKE